MGDSIVSEEHDRAKTVRQYWWKYKTTDEQRDGVIKEAFDKAHQTNDAIRKIADECKNKTGN